MNFLNSAKKFLLALALVPTLIFNSCDDSFIYEDEGDCTVKYYIQFVYNMNLKWADAFPSEVNSVNLYVFDKEGVFIKEYQAYGEELTVPGYKMQLDLPAGDYQFLAWCGLVNDGVEGESFTVPVPVEGKTTIEEMTCALNTVKQVRAAEEPEYSDTELKFMYHGYLAKTLEDQGDGESYLYTMYLTKDTNHIRIILQELSSNEDMTESDYDFKIEAANGLLAYNNSLLPSPVVTYLPWATTADEVGVGRIDVNDGVVKYTKGVVADFSVDRMMESQKNDFMLTITKAGTQEIIARVPVIQYALLSKPYYESAYKHSMTEQEFLDREDEYIMTFFLEKGKWISQYIDILQWRIILHNYNLTTM